MKELMMTTGNAQPIQVQEITTDLFTEFVQWIDRSPATTRTYLTNLRQFMEWIKKNGIRQPIRKDIVSYRDDLVKRGCKPNTINAYLRTVKMFFAWTAASGYYPDIAQNIHGPKTDHSTHKKDALTAKEVITIEQSIKDRAQEKTAAAASSMKDSNGKTQRSTEQGKRLYAMYLLSVNAGLRTVEISRANIKDLETKNGQTWLYVFGKGRTEPDQKKAIAPDVAAAINDYINSRTDHPTGNSPLFVSTGNRAGGKRIATTTISTMLKKAMQEAGFDSERLTAHSLRHSAGTAAMKVTGNLYKTQKYMRHANPATTEIYIHDDTERTQDAQTAARVYDYYHGKQDDPAQLESILQRMTPEQIAQITGIAAAMAG